MAPQEPPVRSVVTRIEARVKVGKSLLAASDDPIFLGLRGPSGREFRLLRARGKSFRRGSEDTFVLGAPEAPETNVAHPELNDPAAPPLDAAGVISVYLRKGFDPVPNVRAVGEMDDRIELLEVEVELHSADAPKPVRFHRRGPIWLGLVAGLRLELSRTDAG